MATSNDLYFWLFFNIVRWDKLYDVVLSSSLCSRLWEGAVEKRVQINNHVINDMKEQFINEVAVYLKRRFHFKQVARNSEEIDLKSRSRLLKIFSSGRRERGNLLKEYLFILDAAVFE